MHRLRGALACGLSAALLSAAALAQTGGATAGYAERWAALCAACHGPQGASTLALVPSVGGQPSFYVATQLFLFRDGRDLAGGRNVPRLAHQREDHLLLTLRGYRSGQRVGDTAAMSEALVSLQPQDLDDLAHFLAYFPAEAAR